MDLHQSRTTMTVNKLQSFVDVLAWRAKHQPNRVAYTFLTDGEITTVNITYDELDRKAKAIASHLTSLGAVNKPVLLIFPSGLEYIASLFGCFYAQSIAVPLYPPHRRRDTPRLEAVAKDTASEFALTGAKRDDLFKNNAQLKKLQWITIDEITSKVDESTPSFSPTATGKESIALLQYTSGSTANPRGVSISHGNLLANQRAIQATFGHSSETVGLGWLPLFHDMGLIGNVLQPLYVGFPCVLMSPSHFLQKPYRWLAAVSRYKATTSGGPNFAYELCARRIPPDQKQGLDLRSWNVAFVGAEPIRTETLDRFCEAFTETGFRRTAFLPCYGLAEATLFVSGKSKGTGPTVSLTSSDYHEPPTEASEAKNHKQLKTVVSCGRAAENHRIVIADPKTLELCADGEIGEIFVSGPSVAQGYWNDSARDNSAFNTRIPELDMGSFLRTGDLGFLLRDELYVTGRIKDLIIIRGRNIYPEDIERTSIESHLGVRDGGCVAFSDDNDGEEKLVVVQEVNRSARLSLDTIAHSIGVAIAESHAVEPHAVVLIRPHTLPRTTSGKFQRGICKAKYIAGDLDAFYIRYATTNGIENFNMADMSALEERIAKALRTDPLQLRTDTSLRLLGLDSLGSASLSHYLQSEHGISIPASQLLGDINVEQLLKLVSSSGTLPARDDSTSGPIFRTQSASFKLSRGQQALWFLHQFSPDSAAYNVGEALIIHDNLELSAFRRAFHKLVDRHPILHMVIRDVDGIPMHMLNELKIELNEYKVSAWEDELLKEHLVNEIERPFDLSEGPLIRASLYKRRGGQTLLLFVIHHIIEDFWSLIILLQDLAQLYILEKSEAKQELPQPGARYDEFVNWEEKMLAGSEGEAHWRYWQSVLPRQSLPRCLPKNKPSARDRSFKGGNHYFQIESDMTARILNLARSEGVTPYTFLLTTFCVQLFSVSGQCEFFVGSPMTARIDPRWSGVVGYFDNLLPIKADLRGDPSFRDLLQSVRGTVLDVLEHQAYPLPAILERLQPKREPGRFPLFDVVFVYRKSHIPELQPFTAFSLTEERIEVDFSGLRIESFPLNRRVAQFDLTLALAEANGNLYGAWEYSDEVFDQKTIKDMTAVYLSVINSVVENVDEKLSCLASKSIVLSQLGTT